MTALGNNTFTARRQTAVKKLVEITHFVAKIRPHSETSVLTQTLFQTNKKRR
jgi:hypothetical protein